MTQLFEKRPTLHIINITRALAPCAGIKRAWMTPNAASLSRGLWNGGVGRARLVCEAAPPRPACDKAQPYPSGPRSLPCQAFACEYTPRETHTVRLGGSGSPPSPMSAASEPVSSPLLHVYVVVVVLFPGAPASPCLCFLACTLFC